MNKEKLQELIKELIERINLANTRALTMKIPVGQESNTFLHDGDTHFVNPKVLPFHIYCDIVELYRFVKQYPKMTDEELYFILTSNEFYFRNLRRVYEKVPNLLKEFKSKNEEKHVPYLYANVLMTEKIEKKSTLLF